MRSLHFHLTIRKYNNTTYQVVLPSFHFLVTQANIQVQGMWVKFEACWQRHQTAIEKDRLSKRELYYRHILHENTEITLKLNWNISIKNVFDMSVLYKSKMIELNHPFINEPQLHCVSMTAPQPYTISSILPPRGRCKWGMKK